MGTHTEWCWDCSLLGSGLVNCDTTTTNSQQNCSLPVFFHHSQKGVHWIQDTEHFLPSQFLLEKQVNEPESMMHSFSKKKFLQLDILCYKLFGRDKIYKICPEGTQPCNMKNRDIYRRRYKIQETLYIGQRCLSSLQNRHFGTSHSSPNSHQLPHCIFLNLIDGLKSLPFQR